MSQQSLTVVVDCPDDQATAVESAAAAAVESIQSAGVIVIAATFGGASLLPTPEEALRAAIDALAELAKGTPGKTALQAAIDKVDAAALVVEAQAASDPAPAPAGSGGVALPVEPPAAPAPEPDPAVA